MGDNLLGQAASLGKKQAAADAAVMQRTPPRGQRPVWVHSTDLVSEIFSQPDVAVCRHDYPAQESVGS
jgi:hypothetical protein